MKLSMWILADWLEKYRPIINIKNGKQVLQSARILSPDTCIEPQNIYLAPAKEFISNQEDKIICVHDHDMLLLDTTDMDKVLNDILDAFDYYSSWSDELTKDIADGCTLQHLVDRSCDIFREPMAVFDAGQMVIAHTTQYGPDDVDDGWRDMLQTGSGASDLSGKMKGQLYQLRYRRGVQELKFPFFSVHTLQKVLFHEGNVIGQILLLEFHRWERKGAMQLLDTLGSLVELWMNHTREDQLSRTEYDVLADLLDGIQVSEKALNYKLSMMGWEKQQEKRLLKLEIPMTHIGHAHSLLSELERLFPDCYILFHQKYIYILVNLSRTSWEHLERELNRMLEECVFHCAVSYPFYDMLRFPTAAEQCRLTLQVASEKKGGIYYCGDHALHYIRNTIHTVIEKSVVHPALYALKQNDKTNQNDLYTTLRVYLENNCSLAHTAQALKLHRNSLLYRLNKIRRLTDLDLDTETVRDYLRLSYIVLEG